MPLYLKGLLDFPGRRYQDIKGEYMVNKVFCDSRQQIRLSISRKLRAFASEEPKKMYVRAFYF